MPAAQVVPVSAAAGGEGSSGDAEAPAPAVLVEDLEGGGGEEGCSTDVEGAPAGASVEGEVSAATPPHRAPTCIRAAPSPHAPSLLRFRGARSAPSCRRPDPDLGLSLPRRHRPSLRDPPARS